MNTNKSIYIVSTFDTKADETEFIKDLILKTGLKAKTVDVSTQTNNINIKGISSAADISNQTIAKYHPQGELAVFCGDRGMAITQMSIAFEYYLNSLDDIAAIIGLGGSGGTAIIAQGFQSLPIGMPKLIISTMASGDISPYIGASDINMLYSVTDIAGINRISKKILTNAAHQMAGAVYFQSPIITQNKHDKLAIGLTMFGVTTPCITQITHKLNDQLDCLVFHATGAGGKSMEKLIDSHELSAVLDLTTTEVCDYLFGGILACNEDRFGALARTQIPCILSCGALDMINFGARNSIPQHYKERLFYEHNSQVTLMRTNTQENKKLGEWIGHKLNQCEGQLRFLIPMHGFSGLDCAGQVFANIEADTAFINALESVVNQNDKRKIIKVNHHINSAEFVAAVLAEFKKITHHLF
ncbi:UPF0261 protein [Gammaproteobacteria bacterium]|nr:UPF0261 protein [Gammaproteobacteria bacterium]